MQLRTIGSAPITARRHPNAGKANGPSANDFTLRAHGVGAVSSTTSDALDVGGSALGTRRLSSGRTSDARQVAIDGLRGTTLRADTGSRGAARADFQSMQALEGQPVERGFVRVSAEPAPGGAIVDVKSFHSRKDDRVTYYLQMEVLDRKTNVYRPVTLSVLENAAVLNPEGFRSHRRYQVNYDDINAWLRARHPTLEVVPGRSKLAVSAFFDGHNAGGFGRDGAFRTPAVTSSAARAAQLSASAARGEITDLPLDMAVAFPMAVTEAVAGLRPDGSIVSRLESEFKGECRREEMVKAIKTMYALAERSQQGKGLGIAGLEGWTLSYVDRYWLPLDSADASGAAGTGQFDGFLVDDNGLPMQDPMRDTYFDDDNLSLTRHEGALRLRTNKQATVINVKPGAGRRDARSGISQRVEVGIECEAGLDVEQAAGVLEGLASKRETAETIFNHAQEQVRELDERIELRDCLKPWLDVTQDRHKFTLTHPETGVEVEISLDSIKARSLRKEATDGAGAPLQAEFYVVEAELDHLQLSSDNQSDANGARMFEGVLKDDAQQTAFLSGLSDDVTTVIDPRLHELGDLDNASFRSTTSYALFEESIGRLMPHIFPDPDGAKSRHSLRRGRQKAAAAAEKMGMVYHSPHKQERALLSYFKDNGYVVSTSLAASIRKLNTTDEGKAKIGALLLERFSSDAVSVARQIDDAARLEVDAAALKRRIAERLESLGYRSTKQVEALVDQFVDNGVAAVDVEAAIAKMERRADEHVVRPLADLLSVRAPRVVVDTDGWLSSSSFGARLSQALAGCGADDTSAPALKDFLARAAAAGAGPSVLRRTLSLLADDEKPQATLDKLATSFAVRPGVTLRPSIERVSRQIDELLAVSYVGLNDEGRQALQSYCRTASLDEVTIALAAARKCERLNGRQLAAAFGLPRVDVTWQPHLLRRAVNNALRAGGLAADEEVSVFFESLCRAGRHIDDVVKLAESLGTHATLPAAIAASPVEVPEGLIVPTCRLDVEAVVFAVQKAEKNRLLLLPAPAEIFSYAEEARAAGLGTDAVIAIISAAMDKTPEQWRLFVDDEYGSTLPDDYRLADVPIRIEGVLERARVYCGNDLTPQIETFVNEALGKHWPSSTVTADKLFNSCTSVKGLLARAEDVSGREAPLESFLANGLKRSYFRADDDVVSFLESLADRKLASREQVIDLVYEGLRESADLTQLLKNAGVDVPADLQIPKLRVDADATYRGIVRLSPKGRQFLDAEEMRGWISEHVDGGYPPSKLGHFALTCLCNGRAKADEYGKEFGSERLTLPPYRLDAVIRAVEKTHGAALGAKTEAYFREKLPNLMRDDGFVLDEFCALPLAEARKAVEVHSGVVPPA